MTHWVKKCFPQYYGLAEVGYRYFGAYGGIRGIAASPFLHASMVISVIFPSLRVDDLWAEMAVSVLPNLLGFTIGGFGMFLSLGDRASSILAKIPASKGVTALQKITAAIVHWIVVQTFALLAEIISKQPADMTAKATSELFQQPTSASGSLSCIVLPESARWATSCESLLTSAASYLGCAIFIYAILLCVATAFLFFRLVVQFKSVDAENS